MIIDWVSCHKKIYMIDFEFNNIISNLRFFIIKTFIEQKHSKDIYITSSRL